VIENTQSSDPNARVPRGPRKMTQARRLLYSFATPILATFLKLVWATFRFRIDEDETYSDLARRNEPVVFAFWHEGLFVVSWYMWQLLKRGVHATFLISPSADGELGTMILARFGSRAVRGSARRSGAAALRGLHRAIRDNRQSPAIAIDGSKGPRRVCKAGAIMAARMAAVPIVPVGFAASRAWRARSWDRHLVPHPGSEIVITVGEPFEVKKKMSGEELEECRRAIEERINHLMEISESRVGVE
jgi:lysophospholipid acyltransferase (LPLAT)-like uncharacterized protein